MSYIDDLKKKYQIGGTKNTTYKGTDTPAAQQKAAAPKSDAFDIESIKSKYGITSGDKPSAGLQRSVNLAKEANQPKAAKKKSTFWKVIDFTNAAMERLSENLVVGMIDPIIKLPGAIKSAASDVKDARIAQDNLRRINANLKARKGESALTKSNEKIADTNVDLKFSGLARAGVEVGQGFANMVYGGTVATLGQAGIDTINAVQGKKTTRGTFNSPFGGQVETVQSSYDRNREAGMSKEEAMGKSVGDIATNVLILTGLVKEIKEAPANFKNSPIFRTSDKVTVKYGDFAKAAAGEKLSSAKQQAILRVENDPAYLAMDARVKAAAIKKGFTVETKGTTSWAEKFGVKPEGIGSKVTVGKPSFMTGATTPIESMAPKGGAPAIPVLSRNLKEITPEDPFGGMVKEPEAPAPSELTTPAPVKASPKEVLKEATVDLRDLAKLREEAALQMEQAARGRQDVSPTELSAISTESPPKVGQWLRSDDGRFFRVVEETTEGAFKIENPATGTTAVRTTEVLANRGIMKLKEGAEPLAIPVDSVAVKAAEAKLKAVIEAEKDARVRQQAAQAELKPATTEGGARKSNPNADEGSWRPLKSEGKPVKIEYAKGKSSTQLPARSLDEMQRQQNAGVIRATKEMERVKDGAIVREQKGNAYITYRVGPEIPTKTGALRRWKAEVISSNAAIKVGRKVVLNEAAILERNMNVFVRKMKDMPGTGPRPGGERFAEPAAGKAEAKTETSDNARERYKKDAAVEADRRTLPGDKEPYNQNATTKTLEKKAEAEIKRTDVQLPKETPAEQSIRIKQEAKDTVAHKIEVKKIQKENVAELQVAAEKVKERISKADTTTPSSAEPAKPVEAKITKQQAMKSLKKVNFLKRWADKKFNPYSQLTPEVRKIFQDDLVERGVNTQRTAAAMMENPLDSIPKKNEWQAIVDYQAGKKNPYSEIIRTAFDKLFDQAKKLGLDIEYRKDYIPQRWANTEGKVRSAAVKYLVEKKGMTPAEAKAYVSGELTLDVEGAARMKMNPSFTFERVFESYADGIEQGLTPATTSPMELYGMYVDEMLSTNANKVFKENLNTAGLLKDYSADRPTWVSVDSFQGGKYAPPEVAYILNGRYQQLNKALQVTSNLSKYGIELTLSAGIPFTPMNYLTMTYTTLGLLRGDVAVLKSFFRSFNDNAGKRWLNEPRQKAGLLELLEQNVDLTKQVNSVSSTYDSFATAWKARNTKKVLSVAWEKMWSRKTFESFLPQYQLDSYLRLRDGFLKEGVDPTLAKQYAASSMMKVFGKELESGRTKTVDAAMTSVFFAPRFRESMVNISANMIKAFGKDRYLNIDGVKIENPIYRSSRKLATGVLTWYAINNILNYKLNGTAMWDNPEGKEMKLRVPIPGSDRVMYVDILPSIMTLPRALWVGTKETVQGDAAKAARAYSGILSMPLKLVSNLATNRDVFGNPIWNSAQNSLQNGEPADDLPNIMSKLVDYTVSQVNHPYLKGLYDLYRGEDSKGKAVHLDSVLSNILEAPATFTGVENEQQAIAYNAVDDLVKQLAFFIPEHRPEVIKRELMKYPKAIRDVMLKSGAWSGANLAIGTYDLTDAELKAWNDGPHPVKLIRMPSNTSDISDDNIFFNTDGTPKGSAWQRTVLTLKALSKDLPGTLEALKGNELIERMDKGIVIFERKSDNRKKLGVQNDTSVEVDHVTAKTLGGRNTKANLEAVSKQYNQQKGIVGNKMKDLYMRGIIGEKEAIRRSKNWQEEWYKLTPEDFQNPKYVFPGNERYIDEAPAER